MTNEHNTVLYCGATNDLCKRILEHKNGVYSNSFTSRYNITKLVYYEIFIFVSDAFAREKQVKGGSRRKKLSLVEKNNPGWNDLSNKLGCSIEELIRIKNKFRR